MELRDAPTAVGATLPRYCRPESGRSGRVAVRDVARRNSLSCFRPTWACTRRSPPWPGFVPAARLGKPVYGTNDGHHDRRSTRQIPLRAGFNPVLHRCQSRFTPRVLSVSSRPVSVPLNAGIRHRAVGRRVEVPSVLRENAARVGRGRSLPLGPASGEFVVAQVHVE